MSGVTDFVGSNVMFEQDIANRRSTGGIGVPVGPDAAPGSRALNKSTLVVEMTNGMHGNLEPRVFGIAWRARSSLRSN